MVTALISFIAVVAFAAVFIYAGHVRDKSIKQYRRRYVSTYQIKDLNQRNFNKAVNIVMDLVKSDSADMEVIYNGITIFCGHMDYDDFTGQEAPHFWYNKEILDKYGIEYD